jgi:ubiquinone/menaquinone biosynthesis C-methylase UbiE
MRAWSTEEVRERYDEAAPTWRMNGMLDSLLLLNRARKWQFSDLTGSVLDVACGTGENFPYLTRARSVTALDLSPAMIEEARRRARQMRIDVDLLAGDAQDLPFSDDRFDFVISAFSSCTFPVHAAAFREMIRVAAPGGEIRLVEHGRSSVGWIARHQDRNVERVHERSACRNNRDVAAELSDAGLLPSSHEVSHLGMINKIRVTVT